MVSGDFDEISVMSSVRDLRVAEEKKWRKGVLGRSAGKDEG